MLLPLLLVSAHAADVPSFYLRQSLGVAGFPTGVISETRFQVRTPLYRSDSMVFQDTYAGAGLRLDLSPAFANPGVQVSLAPIDIFDVDLSATMIGYFPGPFGPLPYDGLSSKLETVRDEREDHTAVVGYSLDAAPTLKLKVGPIIGFDAVAISYIHLAQPAGVTAPYVYDPLRDLIVAWDEVYLEHQPALLYEAMPGGEKPLLYFGASWRQRYAFVSGDRSGALGALLVARPGVKPIIPTIIGFAAFYLIDQDRVGKAPFLGMQANWILEPPLKKAPGPSPASSESLATQ
ncbi:MAG: hypothetical protein Q8P18_09490 [Pseudomonadota bacterium]|nr:hypothetical protein [Pseudomonadota bacterium]